MAELFPLSLQQIRPEPRNQIRLSGLDEAWVARLMQTDTAQWDPVVVGPRDASGCHALIHGFHRYEAARRMKLPSLRCRLADGSPLEEAIRGNSRHAKPLSDDDLRQGVHRLYAQNPRPTMQAISATVGMSVGWVHKVIHSAPPGEGAAFTREQRRERPGPTVRAIRAVLNGWDDEGWPAVREGIAAEIERYDEDEREEVAGLLREWAEVVYDAAGAYVDE